MSDTPISDAATRCAEYGLSVPIETARELERMAGELAEELAEIVDWMKVENAPLRRQEISSIQVKNARWQAMKDAAK